MISPFSLPPTVDDHCSKATDKPMELRCKTSECDISWFKTTIRDENAIMHAYINSPFKGDIQNYTCKS